ncbi:MAG: oligosaccharide flippase family protein [Bacteroidales bacterium]|nr:oligosaccharide flippase family protein [Bacteroidales bacterium]
MKIKQRISLFFSDSLFRNASYLIANSIIGSLAGFIFWLIAARLYTAEDVGLASTIISAIGLLALLSNLGFSISIIRFLSDSKEKARILINSCLTVSASMACVLGVIFVLGVEIFSSALSFIQSNTIFAVVFVLFTILTIVSTLQDSIFVGYRKANLSFIKLTIQSVLKIPIIIFLVAFGSFGIVVSYGIAYIAAIAIAIFILIPIVNSEYQPIPAIDLNILKGIFHYSAGNYIAWVFESIPIFILPILITNILNPEMTAYFYMAWMIASVVFVIPKSMATSLFAEGSNNETDIKQNLLKYIKITFMFVTPATIFLFFIGNKILLLFGEAYAVNGTKILWLLILSTIPMIFNDAYVSIKRVEKNITQVILIYFIITSVTIISIYLLSGQWGILSIGIGWFASQLILSVYTIIYITQFIRDASYPMI